MIYGNAEYIGFPWETILKEYRRKRSLAKFPTVFEWADDIKLFLTDFFNFNSDDEDRVFQQIVGSWIANHLEQSQLNSKNLSDTEDKFKESLMSIIEEMEDADDFLTDGETDELFARNRNYIDNVVTTTFPSLRQLIEESIRYSIKKNYPSPANSGIVIAGFGDKELLPSLVSFEIDGLFFGKLKCIETNRVDTNRKSRGAIIPFAQTDMVYRFMEGIDPSYAVIMMESVSELMMNTAITTAKVLTNSDGELEKVRPALEASVVASMEKFWKANDRLRNELFSGPIIDMAMSLPKDELANLAESLVSLTSLQRRVSRGVETVGGAIDVAVISKGDGFVWIKRKHYFSPDRNLRFVNSYFSQQGVNHTKPEGTRDGDIVPET